MPAITTQDQNQYLTEAAAALRVRRATGRRDSLFKRDLSAGTGPEVYFQVGSPQRFFLPADVDTYISGL